jgi:hypothetical protein
MKRKRMHVCESLKGVRKKVGCSFLEFCLCMDKTEEKIGMFDVCVCEFFFHCTPASMGDDE